MAPAAPEEDVSDVAGGDEDRESSELVDGS
jgi:hypothetical protein